jgi:transcriptional regulator with GAF, ATPase, and Fis domain
VLDHVGRVAMTGDVLHLHGETGVGKDVAARIFHKSGRRSKGPFVPVNCAAIPASIAERLFFGVRRGAYTGADEDADGFVQSADGGTLFLDEIADLDLAVQAKLLRTLESGEVVPLGGAKPRRVDLAAVSATTVHLETRVAERAFRQDLFFRIARPAIHVPPLRERAEEIPWLASRIASDLGRQLHVSFVEAALCRAWPGNVRELLAEVRAATQSAGDEGSPSVRAVHLAPSAGALFEKTAAATRTTEADEERRRQHSEIVEALRREGGNVAATARRLGLHRTQLRRLMARHEIDPHAYGR